MAGTGTRLQRTAIVGGLFNNSIGGDGSFSVGDREVWNMEALITLNCSKDTEKVVDIIKVFQQIGWSIYNSLGKIEYLPIGDDDDYDWQCENMSESSNWGTGRR